MRPTIKSFLTTILIAAACAASLDAAGALPVVRAETDKDSISIGDHFTLRVTVEKDMMQVVDFPVFSTKDRFREKIIVVEDRMPDTISDGTRRQTVVKEYLLTSFSAGEHDLSYVPVLYLDKNIVDTLYAANPLKMLVTTFPVDVEKETIHDIKIPEDAPVLVGEFRGYVIAGIVFACAVAAAIFLIRRYIQRRGNTPRTGGEPHLSEPPHVKAIRELEELHNRKIWQNDRHKLYYTRLTDIIRAYLSERYGIAAPEMTSDEILATVSELKLSAKSFTGLRELLLTADLVKFAKAVPETETNEELYYKAYYFVEETKELPETTADNNTEKTAHNEQDA